MYVNAFLFFHVFKMKVTLIMSAHTVVRTCGIMREFVVKINNLMDLFLGCVACKGK